MSTLHLIQRPISNHEFISQFKLYYAVNDSILFLNDAVFSLTSLCNLQELCELSELNSTILALREHLQARGLNDLFDTKKVSIIDYQKFVELSIEAQKIISW